jgi:hypothetical protein
MVWYADGSPLACCSSGNAMVLYLVTPVANAYNVSFQILSYPDKTVVYNSYSKEGGP